MAPGRPQLIPGVCSVARASRIVRGVDWGRRLVSDLEKPPSDIVSWVEQHARLLKSDEFSRVGLLEVGGQPCCLKLYLAKSPLQRLGFRLGYGRSVRSFDSAGKLAACGLPVPEPMTCLVVQGGMVLLSRGIADSSDLRALWLARPTPEAARQFMAGAGSLLASLHRAGFSHGDCKWSNLLWNGERFYLVDLEAVRTVKPARSALLPIGGRQLLDVARYTIDAERLRASQADYDVFINSYCSDLGCDRERVVAGMRPALEAIRKRHRETHGLDNPALV